MLTTPDAGTACKHRFCPRVHPIIHNNLRTRSVDSKYTPRQETPSRLPHSYHLTNSLLSYLRLLLIRLCLTQHLDKDRRQQTRVV